VLAANELAKRYVERNCEGRQDALVHGFAELDASDGAGEDVGGFRELVDAVAACDSEAEGARSQRFCPRSPTL
jgi:hypothetical protein